MELKAVYVFAINPRTGNVDTGISSSCGACRQTAVNSGNPMIYFAYGDALNKMRATELLPDPLLLKPHLPTQIDPSIKKCPQYQLDAILDLQRDKGVAIDDKVQNLFVKAIEAAHKASYSDYTRISEGAALMTQEGEVFAEANFENASYGASNTAIAGVYQRAQTDLRFRGTALDQPKMLAVFSFDASNELLKDRSPSGLCRQVAAEFGLSTRVYYVYGGLLKCRTIHELLPKPFTFKSIQPHH